MSGRGRVIMRTDAFEMSKLQWSARASVGSTPGTARRSTESRKREKEEQVEASVIYAWGLQCLVKDLKVPHH